MHAIQEKNQNNARSMQRYLLQTTTTVMLVALSSTMFCADLRISRLFLNFFQSHSYLQIILEFSWFNDLPARTCDDWSVYVSATSLGCAC